MQLSEITSLSNSLNFKNKKVLFITTKNTDYIRNTQEVNIIKESASSYKVIGSAHKSYLKRLLFVYTRLLFTQASDYDVIFVGFAPQLVIPLFKHKFKGKYIIEDFFISMYDTLCCDRKKFNTGSLIGKLLHKIDESTLNNANLIICDTNTHGDYFANEFHAKREKLHTLYLEADTNIYHPMSIQKPAKYEDKYIVCYFGSILPLQGVNVILDAFKLLENATSKIKLICIGPVKYKLSLSNIDYIDWLPQDELAQYISFSDLCLAGHFNSDIEKAKRTIPGKAYIYQAMNKPMILGDNPANHELFSKDNIMTTYVEMGSPKALADAILRHFELYEATKRQIPT
jgi:glycosyltransferase involved in cell wall biosynthesis